MAVQAGRSYRLLMDLCVVIVYVRLPVCLSVCISGVYLI